MIWRMICLCALLIPTAATADDAWAPLRTLEGQWQGQATGFGQTSELTHTWGFVFGERFLRLQTRSVDSAGAVHEDVGYVSFDSDTDSYVFRQFLSEGFVNTYALEFHKSGILFAALDSEGAGGMRAQLRLDYTDDGGYQMVLDLAGPDAEFKPCQDMVMRKVER